MTAVVAEEAAALDPRLPSPVQEVRDECLTDRGLRLLLKRDDLIHPDLPGNKWRKLKYNLEAAWSQGHSTFLTFGGAYSNHLRATAAAGRLFGFKTIGVVRGEEHRPLNPSLAYAVDQGMELTYLDRSSYRQKHHPHIIEQLRREFGSFYLLPEGGSNTPGVRGCAELPGEIDVSFDVICCPCGTGGTLAGIAGAIKRNQEAIGFSSLKGGQSLETEVQHLQETAFGFATNNWRIEHKFHFGGYAKKSRELEEFIDDFENHHKLRLDWVYVAKMMYGIYALAERRAFAPGTKIIAVITG